MDTTERTEKLKCFTNQETNVLLELYQRREIQAIFNTNKRSHLPGWKAIAEAMETFGYKRTPQQCFYRFENVKRKYLELKKKFEAGYLVDWPFWNAFEVIFGYKRCTKPPKHKPYIQVITVHDTSVGDESSVNVDCESKGSEDVKEEEITSVHAVNATPVHAVNAMSVHAVNATPEHTVNATSVHTVNAMSVHAVNATPVHTVNATPVHTVNATPEHTVNATTADGVNGTPACAGSTSAQTDAGTSVSVDITNPVPQPSPAKHRPLKRKAAPTKLSELFKVIQQFQDREEAAQVRAEEREKELLRLMKDISSSLRELNRNVKRIRQTRQF